MDNLNNAALAAQNTIPDFSLWGLFMHADFFVQIIMLLLLSMSVATWTIWFNKSAQFRRLKKQADRFERAFVENEKLADLYRHTDPQLAEHPLAKIYAVGVQEWERGARLKTKKGELPANLVDRVRQIMSVNITRELENIEKHLSFVATVGSTAPFIGLLGTVWGIMGAFQSIGAAKNTSLAVVAPGIAEALLATAFGLFAAIPAVMAYNKLATEMGRYAGRLEAFAMEFLTFIERKQAAGETSLSAIDDASVRKIL